MDMKRGLVAIVLLLVLVLGGLKLLGTREADTQAATGQPARGDACRPLVILSPHWEGIRHEFDRGFKAWMKERHDRMVETDWRDMGGTSDDLRYIRSQFKHTPEGIGIDIFFGGGTSPYTTLEKEGLLEPYKLPDEILSEIPRECLGVPLYQEDYLYYGATLSGFGIQYNKTIIGLLNLPTPTTWADLAHPKLATWVASADPRSSGSAWMMLEIILQAYGWEEGMSIITRLGANARNFPKASSAITRDVAIGELAYGTAIDFYAYTQIARAGADKVGFIMPVGKTVINADSIGILKGAANLELAQRFLEFVMSEAGQKLWFLPRGHTHIGGPEKFELLRLPVIPHLYEEFGNLSPRKFNPFQQKTGFQFDNRKAAARRKALNDLLGATIIDVHDELKSCWQELIKAGLPPELVKRFSQPPVTEKELLQLGKEKWDDQLFRVKTRTEWVKFASRKYRDIRKAAKRVALP